MNKEDFPVRALVAADLIRDIADRIATIDEALKQAVVDLHWLARRLGDADDDD